MRGMSWQLGAVLICSLAAGACNGVRAEPVRLDVAGAAPSADVTDLAAVLADTVDEHGRLTPDKLLALRYRLDRQLRVLAVSGPGATPQLYPTPPDRWAYLYNARIAWSIKLADLAGPSRQVGPAAMARTFPLDGGDGSLALIDEALLAEARRVGDFRLAACAPGVEADLAPLPPRPFAPQDFPDALTAALSRLVLDERRLIVDVERRRLRLPPMLWACRDLIVRQHTRATGAQRASVRTALAWFVDRPARRLLAEAFEYAVEPVLRPGRLALPREKIYLPGNIGKVEPPDEGVGL